MPSLMIGGQKRLILSAETSLGCSEFCSVTLKGEGVRPEHAYIREHQGALMIVGATRLCELYVNGKKRRRHILSHGDRIQIGGHVIEYRLYDTPQAQTYTQSERIEAYQRLYEFSRRVAEQLQSSELFEVILQELVTLTNADQGVLVSLDQLRYSIRATVDHMERGHEEPKGDLTEVSESVIHRVLTSRQPVLWNDDIDEQEFDASRSMIEIGLCSVMCAPLIIQGELLGAIYVGSHQPQHTFGARDLKALCIFSAQAAMLLKSARAQDALIEDNQRLKRQRARLQMSDLVGSSETMLEIYQRVEDLSETQVNVLVTGEHGVGKGLLVDELHQRSYRSHAPLVRLHCGALPDQLTERELFGERERGAQDERSTHIGSLARAQGGTLFLDEVGELTISLQTRLISELDRFDIRLISATSVNLRDAVERGSFRRDLYQRVCEAEVELPALRDRGGDIYVIAKLLLERLAELYHRPVKSLSSDARQAMLSYTWPGNIRELESRLSQAFMLADGLEITSRDLNIKHTQRSGILLSLKEA